MMMHSLFIGVLAILLSSPLYGQSQKIYTNDQLDSIVSNEVKKQMNARNAEIDLKIEQSAREVLKQYSTDENTRLTWLAIIIALYGMVVGVGIPILIQREGQRKLEKLHEKIGTAKSNVESFIKKAQEEIMADKTDIKGFTDAAKASEKAAKASEIFAQALAEKNLRKKIDLYTKVLELNSDNIVDAYNNRGCVYDEIGDYEQARKDFDKAISINPSYVQSYYNRGCIYLKLKKYDKAIDDFGRVIKNNPNYVEAYNNRGVGYVEKGDYENARKDYDKAISINPDYTQSYYNRGYVYSLLGDYEMAINDCLNVIKLNPKDPKNKKYLELLQLVQQVKDLKARGDKNGALSVASKGLRKAEKLDDNDWIKIYRKCILEL